MTIFDFIYIASCMGLLFFYSHEINHLIGKMKKRYKALVTQPCSRQRRFLNAVIHYSVVIVAHSPYVYVGATLWKQYKPYIAIVA